MAINIILFSGKARHGKDSAAGILMEEFDKENLKSLKIGYGDLVKFIATKYMGWDGNKDEAGRHILQQVGTNKVRNIYPDFWVDFVIKLTNSLFSDYDNIIITDCRFPNEIEAWYFPQDNVELRVFPVRVIRENFESELTEEQKNHPSETALDEMKFEYTITAKDMNELTEKVLKLKDDILSY